MSPPVATGPYGLFHRFVRRRLNARGIASRTAQLPHDVHYYVGGEGTRPTPVVLVHGLGGAANGFSRVLGPLAKSFGRVFALDLPGSGFSPVPSEGPLGLDDQLAVLQRFLREVVKVPAWVIGNSLGGAWSLQLAHDAPKLVAALTLVAPAGAQLSDAAKESLLKTLDVRTHRDAREVMRRLFAKLPLPLLLFAGDIQRNYASPQVQRLVAEARTRGFLETAVLEGLRMPTLVIWGGSEKLLPKESVDFFRAHLPAHAELETIEGFGHVPQVEAPARLVTRLLAFAERHRL